MITTLHLAKENFKFSAGHFTIFSATERENLHGHNFTVEVDLTCETVGNGMTFDYGLAKRAIESLCRSLNETVLLPEDGPFLSIETTAEGVIAHFADERIPFLKRDVTLLPIENVTVEELARWFLDRLYQSFAIHPEYRILKLDVMVTSGPGQGARVSRTLV